MVGGGQDLDRVTLLSESSAEFNPAGIKSVAYSLFVLVPLIHLCTSLSLRLPAFNLYLYVRVYIESRHSRDKFASAAVFLAH